jgi:homoserine kinase type II
VTGARLGRALFRAEKYDGHSNGDGEIERQKLQYMESEVFVICHTHEFEDGSEYYKLIGVFSAIETAEEAMYALSSLPGFADYPDGFTIDKYIIDEINWKEGFITG